MNASGWGHKFCHATGAGIQAKRPFNRLAKGFFSSDGLFTPNDSNFRPVIGRV
jgi:hypothetical protein